MNKVIKLLLAIACYSISGSISGEYFNIGLDSLNDYLVYFVVVMFLFVGYNLQTSVNKSFLYKDN